VHPQLEQESILGHFLLDGLDLEVYLDRILRATTKKAHPRARQNPGYAANRKLD